MFPALFQCLSHCLFLSSLRTTNYVDVLVAAMCVVWLDPQAAQPVLSLGLVCDWFWSLTSDALRSEAQAKINAIVFVCHLVQWRQLL